MKEKKG